MTTYTIVDKDTNPLGPNEIHADQTISVSDGDTYIIDPSAADNITFVAAGGTPADFEIKFLGDNPNDFDVKVESDLTPTVTVADNTDLSDVDFDFGYSDAAVFTAGDNVSLGQYTGSKDGSDSITIGDGFTATKDWDTKGGNDTITIGDDAVFKDFKTGEGDDVFVVGDDAIFEKIDTEKGNDSITIGDRATVESEDGSDVDGGKVKSGEGDDTIYVGSGAEVYEYDGGDGNDTFTTQTGDTNNQNMETTNVVCYAQDTMIETPDGPRAVSSLKAGDLVLTLDHGPQPIRWVRSSDHPLEEAEIDDKPVLIQAGSLGVGRPAKDLIVSPQHRVLVGGNGQLHGLFTSEAFAPAKSLTSLPGIRHMNGKKSITWYQFACDRHEVVVANGCHSESLLLGPMVVNGLTHGERQKLGILFGIAATSVAALNGPPARTCLRVGDVRRHLSKCKSNSQQRTEKEIRKWKIDLAMETYEADRLRETAA